MILAKGMLMTFEPLKVLQSVLEFYYSSGIIESKTKPVSIRNERIIQIKGISQKYEQLLFFLLGHLLPDFTPLVIDFIIEKTSSPQTVYLVTQFLLPPASNTSLNQLREAIDSDDRFRKLLTLAQSDCSDAPSSLDGCSRCLKLVYPVDGLIEEESIPIINMPELLERFDGDEMAYTLLDGFVMNARRHLLLLSSAADKLDWAEAFRHSHALKGGALNVCASPFASRAKAIETAIKAGQYEIVPAAIQQLEHACSELEAAWDSYREEHLG